MKTKINLLLLALLTTSLAWGHEGEADHFLPATIAIEEPFIHDEVNLIFGRYTPGEEEIHRQSFAAVEISKQITPRWQISFGSAYLWNTHKGFDNSEIGLRYLAYFNPASKTIISLGLEAELGGSGSRAVSENATAISPQLLFGQRLGALGFSGILSPVFEKDLAAVDYGIALHYLIPISGLRWFNHLTPIIELPFSTCLEHECDGKTHGSINPGLILWGHKVQMGIEALIPINSENGHGLGALLQFNWHY